MLTIDKNTVKSAKSHGVQNIGSKNKIISNTLTGLNKGCGVYVAKNTNSNVIQGIKLVNSPMEYKMLDQVLV